MALPPQGSASAEAGPAASDLDTEVLVVGAGPVGLWLAAELCAAGIGVRVIEARQRRASWSRGFVVHPRTLEILDSRGALGPFLETGRKLSSWHYAMGTRRLDFDRLPSAFPFLILQPQAITEELLEARLEQCGGTVRRGRRAVSLEQTPDHVLVRLLDEDGAASELTARFVVGCDGARSAVRRALGIGFPGTPDTLLSPSALLELADPPPPEQYIQTHESGIFFAIALPDGRFIISTIDHAMMGEVGVQWTGDMVRDSVRRITGTDYGMGTVERVATLGNGAKQAERYREGRVLLAGDSAHVHFPMGGQGMNLGIQDAHNLAWRLTAVVRVRALGPDADATLLDGYEAERRPAGEDVLEDVRAQMALVAATGADGAALRARIAAMLDEHEEVNLHFARRLAGLDVRYPIAVGEDPRLGRRVPDLELELVGLSDGVTGGSATGGSDRAAGAEGEPTRLYKLLAAIGPGRFIRLVIDPAAPQPAGDGPAEATSQGRAPAESAAASAPDGGVAATVTILARGVHGPEWALRDGWGRAETVLIRPDGHLARIGPGAAAEYADVTLG